MLNILLLIAAHIDINATNTALAGKKIQATAPITKNGPNGIYWSSLFKINALTNSTNTDIIAPTKNAKSEI